MNNDATMKEKADVLRNDLRNRDQEGSTYLSHTHNDTGGRFSAISNPTVIGSTQVPQYPAGPVWTTDPGSQLLEPPLSPHDNPALEPSDLEPSCLPSPAQATPNLSSHQAPPLAGEGLGFSRTFRRF